MTECVVKVTDDAKPPAASAVAAARCRREMKWAGVTSSCPLGPSTVQVYSINTAQTVSLGSDRPENWRSDVHELIQSLIVSHWHLKLFITYIFSVHWLHSEHLVVIDYCTRICDVHLKADGYAVRTITWNHNWNKTTVTANSVTKISYAF